MENHSQGMAAPDIPTVSGRLPLQANGRAKARPPESGPHQLWKGKRRDQTPPPIPTAPSLGALPRRISLVQLLQQVLGRQEERVGEDDVVQ